MKLLTNLLHCLRREDQSTLGIQLNNIENECRKLNAAIPKPLHELHNDLLQALQEQNLADAHKSTLDRGHPPNIKQQLEGIQALLITISYQHRVLRQLTFQDMGSRRNQILDADPATCRWILEGTSNDSEDSDEPDRKSNSSDLSDGSRGSLYGCDSGTHSGFNSNEPEDGNGDSELSDWPFATFPEIDSERHSDSDSKTHIDFISWLASGQGVLHVSGNAGSGKSTI